MQKALASNTLKVRANLHDTQELIPQLSEAYQDWTLISTNFLEAEQMHDNPIDLFNMLYFERSIDTFYLTYKKQFFPQDLDPCGS